MFKIKEPKKALKFEITQAHVTCAVQKDPCNCVIAKAFQEKFNGILLEVQVLSTITQLVYAGSIIHRYKTPDILKEALRVYDDTKEWKLPPGTYELKPIPHSLTCKAQRERTAERRANGEVINPGKRTGKNKSRKINPRLINMREIRKGNKVK